MPEETTTPNTSTADPQSTGQAAPVQSTGLDVRITEMQARIDTLAANNVALTNEKKLGDNAIKGMKAAETKRLAALQVEADKELEAKGDWENRLASQEKQHQKMVEEMTEKYDGTAAALRKAIVENSVIQAATEAQAVSPAQIMAIFGNLFTMDDAMAKAVINPDACTKAGIDPYDAGVVKSVQALMADLAKDEKNLNLFQPTLRQGGAGSAQPSPGTQFRYVPGQPLPTDPVEREKALAVLQNVALNLGKQQEADRFGKPSTLLRDAGSKG